MRRGRSASVTGQQSSQNPGPEASATGKARSGSATPAKARPQSVSRQDDGRGRSQTQSDGRRGTTPTTPPPFSILSEFASRGAALAPIPGSPAPKVPRRSPRLALIEKAAAMKKGLKNVAKEQDFRNLEDDDLIEDKVTGIVETLQELEAAEKENEGKGVDTKAFSFSRVTKNEYPRFGANLVTDVPFRKLAKTLKISDDIIKGFEKAWADVRPEALRSLKDTLRFTAVPSEERTRSYVDKLSGIALRLMDPDNEEPDEEPEDGSEDGVDDDADDDANDVIVDHGADEGTDEDADRGSTDTESGLPDAVFALPEVSVVGKDEHGKKTVRVAYGKYLTLLTGRLDLLLLTAREVDGKLRSRILTRKSVSEVTEDLGWRTTLPGTYFLIIEAKRQKAKLATHMPQVIAQSLALLQLTGQKAVNWCLSTGEKWIFGVTQLDNTSGGAKVYATTTERYNLAKAESVRDIISHLALWMKTPPDDIVAKFEAVAG